MQRVIMMAVGFNWVNKKNSEHMRELKHGDWVVGSINFEVPLGFEIRY